MRVQGEIDSVSTLKNGMKIVIKLGNEETKEAMKHIYKFMDKPLDIDININSNKQVKRLAQITDAQRNKIFAIVKDIATWTGEGKESLREELQEKFTILHQIESFSLSNCSKEIAADFINYLTEIAFTLDIEFTENPGEGLDDIDKYLYLCLQHKKCCICGKAADMHHVETIGMGRDRKAVDESKNLKMALCREHHTEAHKTGLDTFNDKYHVYGIRFND